MAVYDSNREEVIDEPELNVNNYLYCKISGSSNYDDYLYKKACMKLSPQKVLEELDDPELYSQLSNSVISFLKRTEKTSCENSSVSSDSESDNSGHNIKNSSPSPPLRGKSSPSQRSVKKDSLLYQQLSKEEGGKSNSSSGMINNEYKHAADSQQTIKRIPSPQYVIKKVTGVNNGILPLVGEEFSRNQQERKLLPSSMNNNNNNSNNNTPSQSVQELPLKNITKIAQPLKSIKSNITSINDKDFQQKHEDVVNITIDDNNSSNQDNNNNVLLKAYKNVTLNFSKQYRHHNNNIHSSTDKTDTTSCHNEYNNNSSHVMNSKRNSNDMLYTNQLPQSKILYRHLVSKNNKFYNGSEKSCFMPLSSCRNNENLTNDDSCLDSSPTPLPSSPSTLQLYATTTGVPNIICEKNNNFMIPKGTILKTTATTVPLKNILMREPLQQRQQQQRALNIVSGENGSNYDSIITLSLENLNNNNNQTNNGISSMNNSSNNNGNIAGNFYDDNNNNNSEIVIEIGDKNKLAVNSGGSNNEGMMSPQSLHYQQQQQQVAPTMVCLKRGGDMQPSPPQQYNHHQPPLFNRSHVTHIVERRLIASNSNTNKYETTFIQKRSEQLVPIQPCRIFDNKQIIKQYCGPKIKSEKRSFSAVEPVVISSAPTQIGSPVTGGTVKGTDDVFKGVSNEQMSSLQRLLKLGTTATVMSNEEKKIKLETIVKKLWAKELSDPPQPSSE